MASVVYGKCRLWQMSFMANVVAPIGTEENLI